MEPRNHFKNGANLKSQTIKGNIMKIMLLCLFFSISIYSYGYDYRQNATIPDWIKGEWCLGDGAGPVYFETYNDYTNEIVWQADGSGTIGGCTRVDRDVAYFLFPLNQKECKITRISSNQVLYQGLTSGVSYVLTRKGSSGSTASAQNYSQQTSQSQWNGMVYIDNVYVYHSDRPYVSFIVHKRQEYKDKKLKIYYRIIYLNNTISFSNRTEFEGVIQSNSDSNVSLLHYNFNSNNPRPEVTLSDFKIEVTNVVQE